MADDPVEPTILFVDPHLILIDKPGGMLSVPGRGPDRQDCAVARIRKRYPDLPAQPAVHRLDMQTSGLLLLARTAAAHRNLAGQFAHRRVSKRYLAVLERRPDGSSGTIALSFRLDPNNRPYQIYDPVHGKPGITQWRLLGAHPHGNLVEFEPLTGRTHQLRVHAAHPRGLGAPIVGDSLYGNGRFGEPMLLHACTLTFYHPVSGAPLAFFCKPPFLP
jgi:tRNA pseudouridine32 synthase/23S rRNA pseudouridine746 synthase